MTLDKAIKTMRETGADMKDKHKETARGGLALTVVESAALHWSRPLVLADFLGLGAPADGYPGASAGTSPGGSSGAA